MNENIIDIINRNLENMRRSERSVAKYVLRKPDEVIHMRIVDLASEAYVSEPTVVRFCKAIGCDSFASFKLQLAQLLASRPNLNAFSLPEQASTAEYCESVFDTTINTLSQVQRSLDYLAIEAAVKKLANARRVEFYGFGASASVATDAQHKFFRLQISSAAYSDPHIQAMSALSLTKDDVVVAISQSGRSLNLVDSLRMAKQSGACVIGLAPRNTPVAIKSDINIYMDIQESEALTYVPLPSRIVYMAVLDILALGVSRLKGEGINDHLKILNKGLQRLRHY